MTTNPTEKPELLSQPDACRRLGVKYITLYRWCRRPEIGLPKTIKIGDRVFFVRAEFEAWLAARIAEAA